MSSKSIKKMKSTALTAKQWSWQFLRRNPNYRDAFKVMSDLNHEQHSFLQTLIDGQVFEFDIHLKLLETFPTNIFKPKGLRGVKNEHRTLLDYLNDIDAYSKEFQREWGGISEHLQLVLLEKYRCETYAIKNWIDPKRDELTDADEQSLGFLIPKTEHSLVQLGVNEAPPTSKAELSFDALPKQFYKVGKNGQRFLNMRFMKKWQAAIVKISGNGSLAKADPTELDSDLLTNVIFDLSLPIKVQVNAIAAELEAHQRRLQDAGLITKLPSKANRDNIFSVYIVILDLNAEGLSDLEVAIKLKSLDEESYRDSQGRLLTNYFDSHAPEKVTPQEHTASIRKQLERARKLRDFGYKSLALQMD